ncbi:MAG: ImmA/IrrE family metallo-endopeptidase [Acidobacteria bacterium]|nr:ImmA/IrrE family metallo-endopeptidase [Acidobacteriota bacterium]
MRVFVKKELLTWARERAGLSTATLAKRLPGFDAWEQGARQPTLKQLEAVARATHTPVGYLFLAEPPVEHVPIPDFRTVADAGVRRPSPDLLDTIYSCQERQAWYREFARAEGLSTLSFVASVDVNEDIVRAATAMRTALGFDISARRAMRTWEEALRRFVDQAEALGVLVMASGVVGSNTHRVLDPNEFRGFALVDDVAPLVFVNAADSKSAQMFTMAHELAHLWLGQSALSDVGPVSAPVHAVERWCNQVAAEFLVPLKSLRAEYRRTAALSDECRRLARVFKVSTLVVIRRLHDLGKLSRDSMWAAYTAEIERLNELVRPSGGDFYLTQPARVSKRFARAVIGHTLEGHTLYRDAFRMLGVSRVETFQELGRNLGVVA